MLVSYTDNFISNACLCSILDSYSNRSCEGLSKHSKHVAQHTIFLSSKYYSRFVGCNWLLLSSFDNSAQTNVNYRSQKVNWYDDNCQFYHSSTNFGLYQSSIFLFFDPPYIVNICRCQQAHSSSGRSNWARRKTVDTV